jgi:surface protein
MRILRISPKFLRILLILAWVKIPLSDTLGDSNQTGFADSNVFNLDTNEGGGNENPVNLDNSGFADSPSFVLNTTDGNVTQPGDPISGFSDSGGFVLDTTESHGHGQSGFGDSNGFVLDTTGQDDHSDGNGTGGPNQPPADLNSTAPLFIAENQPVGTVVGTFNATDPDGNSSLTYHLVSGAGDGGNPLFTLDGNGTLKTAVVFDYETDSPDLFIRVQARDEHNATMEGNFTVALINLNEPISGGLFIRGNLRVGGVLNVLNNLADPDGFGNLSYNWFRDGVELNASLGSDGNYTVTQDDVGSVLTVVASFIDGGGNEENATSPATPMIKSQNQAPHDLILSDSSILENLAAGSAIGRFHALDYEQLEQPPSTDGVGHLLWTFSAGGQIGFSSPAIAPNGTVYIGSEDGNLYALDGESGALKWSFAAGDSILNSPAIGPSGIVYVGSKDDKLYALNGQTGSKVWDLAIGDDISSTPTIGNNGLVYFGSNDRKLRAVNALTGELVWSFEAAGGIVCSPSIDPDGNVFFGCTERIFYSLDAQTGTMIWQFRVDSEANSSAAIGTDGMIYFGSDKLYALDGRNGEKKWEYGSFYIHSSPAIGMDGTVFFGGEDQKFYALDGESGQKKWSFLTGQANYSTPAIGADGTIYFGSDNSKLYALDSSTGSKKWEFATGGNIRGAMAIGANGMVCFGSNDNKVYAVRGSSPLANSPWPTYGQNLMRLGRRIPTDSNMSFLLTDGNGSTHNHLFSIDSDGFLRTSLIHDFESNSTYSIRVRVTDEHNGSLEKTFAIQISDANEPASGDVLISGVSGVGQVLSASANLSDLDGMGTVSYQWNRNGEPILPRLKGVGDASSFIITNDGKYLYWISFDSNRIYWGERDPVSGALHVLGSLKDGENGVDGLAGAFSVSSSNDNKHVYVAARNDHSVSWFERNASNGSLTYGGVLKRYGTGGVTGLKFASSVSVSDNGEHVYVAGFQDNSICWFDRNSTTGALTYSGRINQGLNGADGLSGVLHVVLSPDGKHAYAESWWNNSISWFDRNQSTGALTYVGSLKDGNNGVDGLRSANSIAISPDGKSVYTTGYDDDAVAWFDRNASSGALTYLGISKDGVNGVSTLNGPRRLTVSGDGLQVYVVTIFSSAVTWFDRNASTGHLSLAGNIEDSSYGIDGLGAPQKILISPDGHHAYVTAPGDSSITWLDRNASNGNLTFPSAVGPSYEITEDDLGSVLSVSASFVDGNGIREIVVSNEIFIAHPGPEFHTASNLAIPENQTLLIDLNASHPDGDTLTYSILYGDDKEFFELNASSGALRFLAAPDFEHPDDNNSDNVYELTVQVSDGNATDILNLYVTVLDVFENTVPAFQSDGNLSVAENQTFVYEFNATDPDGHPLSYSILYGDDANAFDLNTSNGILSFLIPPDYEHPDDNTSDNIYELTVQVSDGNATDILNLYVRVLDENENSTLIPLTDANFKDAIALWFSDEANATATYGHISDWNVSAVTDMSRTFWYASIFNEDISEWDVSSVTDMNGMFFMAGAFNQPIGDWNVSSVTNMQEMFDGAGSFNQPIGNWDLSSVTNIRRMLRYASDFNQPIGNWDVSAVTKMDGMFFAAGAFDQPIWSWNVSLVTNMQEMFDGAASFNQPIGNWDVSSVTNMHRVFRGTHSFDQDISDWNVSGATTMAEMFVNNGLISEINKGRIHQSFSSNPNWPYDWSSYVQSPNPPTDLNSTAPLSVSEDWAVGTIIGAFTANDADANATLSYWLLPDSNGSDQFFDLNSTTGVLRTATTFDYESNASFFVIRVQVRDEHNESAGGNFTVTLVDVFENTAPFFAMDGNLSVPENEGFVAELNGSDPDGGVLTYSILYGDDKEFFELNGSSGTLQFIVAPDYEHPDDNNSDNLYELTVGVDDGNASGFLNLYVRVTDVFENTAPFFAMDGNLSVPENQGFVVELNGSDPEGVLLTYSILYGDDKEFFELNGSSGTLQFITAPDYEHPDDNNSDNLYELTVGVDDGNASGFLNLYVHVLDFPDHNDSDTGGTDMNETLESGHPIFDLNETALHELAGDWLPAGPYALVEMNGSILDLEPVFLDPNGTWFPTPSSDYLNLVPDRYGFVSEVIEWFELSGYQPVGYLPFDQSEGNHSDPWDHNHSEYGPIELFLTNDRLSENLPVGSVVGQFQILFPGENNGSGIPDHMPDSNLTIELLMGSPHFVLHEGNLLSNEVFDYEEFSGHLVMVGVFGPEGLLYEREFTIRIIDRFQPIVRTLPYLETESHGFSLGGNLLDAGEGTAFIETGILLSGHPKPSFEDNESLILISDSNGSGPFEIFVDDLLPGQDYYYRAYAANAEGISFGSTHRLRTPKPSNFPDWSDALPLGDAEGWWQSPWFGSFFMGDGNGWIMHAELGWIFVLPQSEGVWLWQAELGWLWTSGDTYPYFFENRGQNWLFHHGSNGVESLFFSFAESFWIRIPRQ